MKFIALTIFLCWFINPAAFAQDRSSSNGPSDLKIQEKSYGSHQDLYFLCRESIQKEFKRSEFLNASFETSEFLSASGKWFQAKLRFNHSKNEMQILFNSKICVLYPHLIDKIILHGATFSPKMIQTEESQNYVYLKQLVAGKLELYQSASPKDKNRLYVNKQNKTDLLKLKRKALLAIFEENETQVDRFIIEKNLNFREQEDLKRIFYYYNSL